MWDDVVLLAERVSGLTGWDQWISVPSESAAFAATSITQMGLVHFAASDD
jgi:hypothetical protein